MTMRIFYIFFIYEPQKKPQVGTGTGKFTFTGNKLLIIQYYFSCLACTQRGMDPFQISSDGSRLACRAVLTVLFEYHWYSSKIFFT